MINMTPAFYNKIGTPRGGNRAVFRYIFASTEPHCYFSAYIIPAADTFDMYYTPYIDNLYSNDIINMGDSATNKVIGVPYGDSVELTVSNSQVEGYGKLMNISVTIPDRPACVNIQEVLSPDVFMAKKLVDIEVAAIEGIGLYALKNIIGIEVESKLHNIMNSGVGVQQVSAVRSIINSILVAESIFYNEIPAGIPPHRQELLHLLYMRLYSADPKSANIADIFAGIVEFARVVDGEEIAIENIPYSILFRLVSGWVRDKSEWFIRLLKTAAANIEKTEELTLSISTMDSLTLVHEALSLPQSFVYLTSITIENVSTGETLSFSVDNVFFENFTKSRESCLETKGIMATEGVVCVQYGYGLSCDSFIGIYAKTRDGKKYGIAKTENLTGGVYRTMDWGDEHIEVPDNEPNNTQSLRFAFKGV
jgi:hypothetical protein